MPAPAKFPLPARKMLTTPFNPPSKANDNANDDLHERSDGKEAEGEKEVKKQSRGTESVVNTVYDSTTALSPACKRDRGDNALKAISQPFQGKNGHLNKTRSRSSENLKGNESKNEEQERFSLCAEHCNATSSTSLKETSQTTARYRIPEMR